MRRRGKAHDLDAGRHRVDAYPAAFRDRRPDDTRRFRTNRAATGIDRRYRGSLSLPFPDGPIRRLQTRLARRVVVEEAGGA